LLPLSNTIILSKYPEFFGAMILIKHTNIRKGTMDIIAGINSIKAIACNKFFIMFI
tara:strand:- start:321 stop:488 length:168 start_codon:yes stop_codon:yes gene_type:complete